MSEMQKQWLFAKFRVLILYIFKGGVGKTTLCQLLASAAAALGLNVILVDTDMQRNCTSLAYKRIGRLGGRFPHTIIDVMARRNPLPLQEALFQVEKGLWLLPADSRIEELEFELQASRDYSRAHIAFSHFAESLAMPEPFEKRFPWWNQSEMGLKSFSIQPTTDEEFLNEKPSFVDLVIVDCPPYPSSVTESFLFASDGLIAPTDLEDFSIQGLIEFRQNLARKFFGRNHRVHFEGILPNKVKHPQDLSSEKNQAVLSMTKAYLTDLNKTFPGEVFRPVHLEDVFTLAQYEQTNSFNQKHAKNARGVREIAALVLELIGWQGDMKTGKICNHCYDAIEAASV